MNFSRLTFASLWICVYGLCWLSRKAEAAAAASPDVFCTDIDDVGEVCAMGSFTTPSPAQIEGVLSYLGGYSDSYQITNAADEATGWEITTMLSDDGVCEVLVKYPEGVDTESCQSCTLCGDEKTLYTADCTNLLYGRMVDCESSSVYTGDVYFPLTAQALVEFSADGGEDMPMEGGGKNATDGGGKDDTDGEEDMPMEGGDKNATEGGGMGGKDDTDREDMPMEGGGKNATDGGGKDDTDGDEDMLTSASAMTVSVWGIVGLYSSLLVAAMSAWL